MNLRKTFFQAATIVFVFFFAFSTIAATYGSNLVANGTFEQVSSGSPSGWSKGNWGSLSAHYIYPASGRSGSGASVTVSNYVSGDAKWMPSFSNVTGSSKYQYKDYFKSTTRSEVIAQYQTSSGASTYVYLGESSAKSSWTQGVYEFTTPSSAVRARVFRLIESNGTVAIDDVELRKVEDSTTPPPPPNPTPTSTPVTKGMVSLTFDDGWYSQYSNAAPILDQAGYKGVFYITTEHLDPDYSGFMKNADVKSLYSRGHEIGGHTVNHLDLTTLSSSDLNYQLKESKTIIESIIGKTGAVKSIAYPYGAYNSTVTTATKNAGYANGRTTDDEVQNKVGQNPYTLKSISPTIDTSLSSVKTEIDKAIKDGSWLIIAFHEVDNSGVEYSNTPQFVKDVVSYLKSKNANVVTVTQGMSLLK